MEQQRTISFSGLIVHVFKGWRSILIWMLVLAVLFTGIGFARTSTEVLDPTAEDEIVVDLLLKQEKQYNDLLEYMEKAPLLDIDPLNANTGTLTYRVDTGYRFNPMGEISKDLTPDICAAYAQLLNNDDWRIELLNSLNSSIDPVYFSELCRISSQENSFTISVYFADREKLQVIMDYIAEFIESHKTQMDTMFIPHTLTLINSSITTRMDKWYAETRDSVYKNKGELEEAVQTAKDDLTATQRALYQEQSAEELPELPQPSRFNKLLLVLGAFLGAFVVCGIRACTYLFSDKVNPDDNFSALLNIPELGCVCAPDNGKNGLGKKIDQLFAHFDRKRLGSRSKEQQRAMIVSNIHYLCKENAISRVYLGSTAGNLKETSNEIASLLKAQNIDVVELDELNNAQLANDMQPSDGLVLLEKAGKSTYTDLDTTIHFYNGQHKNLLGIAVEL